MAKFPTPTSFELIPEGDYPAVLVKLLDLGTQTSKFGTRHQVMLVWELIGPRTKDDRPFEIARFCNFSTASKATFRGLTEPMLGRRFTADDFGEDGLDLSVLLGKPCLLKVGHAEGDDGTIRAIVAQTMKLPKAQSLKAPDRALEFLWLTPEEFDERVFLLQSQRVKDIIAASPEYLAVRKGKSGELVTPSPAKPSPKPKSAGEAARQLETIGADFEGLDPGGDRDPIDA